MTKLILIGPLLDSDQSYQFEEKVIFVDGGINFKDRIQYQDFDSIGDQDSTQESLNITLDKKKDRSDLFHALELAKDHPNIQELDLHGFVGQRLDHQFFNIGEAYQALNNSSSLRKINFYKNKSKVITIFNKGENTLDFHGQFSISSLNPCSIKLEGDIKYRGTRQLLPLSSQGLSNIAYGKFSISSDQPLIFFYTT